MHSVKAQDTELARSAWQRAEDTTSRLCGTIEDGLLLEDEIVEISALCSTYGQFVPKRLKDSLNNLVMPRDAKEHGMCDR